MDSIYKNLFRNANDLLKEEEERLRKTGEGYNVFDALNITYNEVQVCRFIYSLLNEKGGHNQGKKYLKLFLKIVLNLSISDLDFATLKVHREYRIDGDRRIDLVISSSKYFIPIELKIFAEDQNSQCFDYYRYAVKSNIYYVTLFGTPPSIFSRTRGNEVLEEKYISLISFSKHILAWINACIKVSENLHHIYFVLKQFRKSILILTNQHEKGVCVKLDRLIGDNPDNIRAALEIEKSVNRTKIMMLNSFLKVLEVKLYRVLNVEKIQDEYDYEKNSSKVYNFYDVKNSTCPGFSLPIDPKKFGDVEGVDIDFFAFRVEIVDGIVIGIVTPKNWSRNQVTVDSYKMMSEDALVDINAFNESSNGWWIYREALILNNMENAKFKTCNSSYISLYDKDVYDDYIEACSNRIVEVYEYFNG